MTARHAADARSGTRQLVLSALAEFLKRRSQLVSWVQAALAVTSAALGFFGSPLAGRADTVQIVAAIVALGISVVIGQGLEWAQKKVDEAQRDVAARSLVAVKDALRPVAELIATMPGLSRVKCESRLKEVAWQVAGSMDLILDTPRLRTVVYKLTDQDTMENIAYLGGAGTQPGAFKRHSPGEPDRAFEALETNEPVVSQDVHQEQDRRHRAKNYRSYVSVPIVSETRAYGMLAVDAPEPDAFTQSDIDITVFVAELLAIAFRTAAEKS